MGLDMYLYRKTYVKNWKHMTAKERHEITVTRGGKTTAIKPERIAYILEEVAYWRKANQIHGWFVKHVQNGIDDCGCYRVTGHQLRELLKAVSTILDNREKAAEVLATQSGFFFGSTDYDEFYFQDLKETKAVLTTILGEDPQAEFEYQSSW